MAKFPTLDSLDVAKKCVLVRVDFNVPMRDGAVSDATRIERSVPTIQDLIERRARVVLMSHFGRPKGQARPDMSLRPVAEALRTALGGTDVVFAEDCIGPAAESVVGDLPESGIALLENLRFHPGEEDNDPDFAAALAKLGDVYVNDAFSASHRSHASVDALPRLLPAAAGKLMAAELQALHRALEEPERPAAFIVGGAKISTKLELLGNLMERADVLVVGGAMANTFLHALGVDVGASLYERDMADAAREILDRAQAGGCDLILPSDVVAAAEIKEGVPNETVTVKQVPPGKMILDIGPATVENLITRLRTCRTVVWNGPLGAFETPPFDEGTNAVARAVAERTQDERMVSVAGGGDTVAALINAGVLDDFSYVSTAGGAFLEWLEGRTLPGIAALMESGAGLR